MTPADLTDLLRSRFDEQLQVNPPDAWQVDTPTFRLLVLLSADQSWLRVLVPIASAQDIQSFLVQILEANFDLTQEVRYALHQEVLWGVFQHSLASLTAETFTSVVERLLILKQEGIDPFFNALVETQIRQIVQAAKRRGQSLEDTLQTLDRFYAEGMMGDMNLGGEYQGKVLAAWQRQLGRLWSEVDDET